MSAHRQSTEEIAETAALYALGLLSNPERLSLEQHLAEGCAVCQLEIDRTGSLLAAWAQESAISPPLSLRKRLLTSIRQSRDTNAIAESPVLLERSGLKAIRTAALKWQAGPVPGMWTKVLFDDRENDESTILIRMRANSIYPPHRHKGIEEVYVLEGSLQVEGVELTAGDFCLSRPESVHQATYSKFGCLLMVKTSKRDEVLG